MYIYDDWGFHNRRNNNGNENEDFSDYVPEILRDNIYSNGRKRKFNTESLYGNNFRSGFLAAEAKADRERRMAWFERKYQEELARIARLEPTEKLGEAITRSGKYLRKEIVQQLQEIFTPATLATMMGVFAVYLAA